MTYFETNENTNDFAELREAMHYWGSKIPYGSYKFYVGGNIPDKKLTNAISNFAQSVSKSTVIGLLDLTIFGSCDEGIIFTTTGIHFREILTDPIHIKYADIAGVEIIYCDDDDNDRKLHIFLMNGNTIKIESTFFNKTPLCRFLERASTLNRQGKTEFSDINIYRNYMQDAILRRLKGDNALVSNEGPYFVHCNFALNKKAENNYIEYLQAKNEEREENIKIFIRYYENLNFYQEKRKLLTWLYKLAKKTEYKYDLFDDLKMNLESKRILTEKVKKLFLELPTSYDNSLFLSYLYSECNIKAEGYKRYTEKYLPELLISILGNIETFDNLVDRQLTTEEKSQKLIETWRDMEAYKKSLEDIKKEKLKLFKEQTGASDEEIDIFFTTGGGSGSGGFSYCRGGTHTGQNLALFVALNVGLIGLKYLSKRYSKHFAAGKAEAKHLLEQKYNEIKKEFDEMIQEGNSFIDNYLVKISDAEKEIYQLKLDIAELESFVD